ncbi:MAG: hypothetical protein KC668_29995 [Myxococcales bacterium]|nr:hypothetical protein [Myxococcales bacterium]
MSSAPDSAAFHAAVAARRDYLNALFRREGRGVQPEVFMAYLRDVVGPLVDAAAGGDMERAEELTLTLYRLSLRAHRQGLLGGERPSATLHQALHSTLPALLGVFPDRPRDLTLALCNAALRLERLEPAKAARWLDGMESLGPSCADLDALFALGLVLAWRAGAAEFHASAAARFPELSPMLRRATLGVEELPADPARRFTAPLDDGPLGAPLVVAELGGFVGFGGVFHDPPLVAASEGRLFAFDSQCTTEIFADAFGATLRQVADPPETASDAPVPLAIDAAGAVELNGARAVLPLLAGASSHAWANGVSAVTLPHSHFVFVVGRQASL